MNLSFGFLKRFAFSDEAHGNQAMIISGYSFALFLINVLLIFIVAMIFFRLKVCVVWMWFVFFLFFFSSDLFFSCCIFSLFLFQGISYAGVQREWARAKMHRENNPTRNKTSLNHLSIYSTDNFGGKEQFLRKHILSIARSCLFSHYCCSLLLVFFFFFFSFSLHTVGIDWAPSSRTTR
jgi:hypothetical protein